MQFKSFFSEKTHYYLVTELMTGGELFERIVEKEFYSEEEARCVHDPRACPVAALALTGARPRPQLRGAHHV